MFFVTVISLKENSYFSKFIFCVRLGNYKRLFYTFCPPPTPTCFSKTVAVLVNSGRFSKTVTVLVKQ